MSDACLGNQRFNIRNIRQNADLNEIVDLKFNKIQNEKERHKEIKKNIGQD